MRIVSGSARGKRLATFTDNTVRPTPDRVREALFSILFSRLGPLEGKAVLDLFAGTGALALEALSRGARRAVLVDQGTEAARLIPTNLQTCRLQERATFLRSDVLQALPRLHRDGAFDLIFLDPPYGRGLVSQVVAAIDELGLLADGGLVCAEADRKDDVPDAVGGLCRVETRRYGTTAIHLFTQQPDESSHEQA